MRQSLEMRRLPPGPRHHRLRSPIAILALLVTVALASSACGSTAPSLSPSPRPGSPSASATGSAPPGSASPTTNATDEAAVYAAINRQVEAIRGLDERSPVTPTLVWRLGKRVKAFGNRK